MDYILPFFIIICIGIIIVLLVNLVMSFFSRDMVQGAYMHLDRGSVQMRSYGTDDFFNLSSDVLILEGDEIKTSADARVIVEFFDGTIMRIDGGSDIAFTLVDDEDYRIEILLLDGKVWVNKIYRGDNSTNFHATGNHITVKSDRPSIFEVESEFDDVVRVFQGEEVSVEIKSEDDSSVVDTETVGVGQEIVFSDEALKRYWQFQSPNILSALSDDFKKSQWYLWNIAQDKNPTEFVRYASSEGQFVQVDPEIKDESLIGNDGSSEEDPDDIAGEGETQDEELNDAADIEPADNESTEDESVDGESADGESADEISAPLTTPKITSVAGITETNSDGYYEVSSSLATLTGSVTGAQKVVVNDYTLTKFNPGDTTWTYFANAQYNLMSEGENTYTVYAVDENGTRSDILTVKVLYTPNSAPATESAEDDETDAEAETDSDVSLPDPEEDAIGF